MSNNSASDKPRRGRPSTGKAMDGSIFLRIPSARKEEVRDVVKAFLAGLPVPEAKEMAAGADSGLSERVRELERENAGLKEQMALKAKEAVVSDPQASVPKDVMALLESNDALMKERDQWKVRFEKAVDAFPNEQAQYWRATFLKFKAEVEKQHGPMEISQ